MPWHAGHVGTRALALGSPSVARSFVVMIGTNDYSFYFVLIDARLGLFVCVFLLLGLVLRPFQ